MANSSKITPKDTKHIAKLANLVLSDDEINKFTSQLDDTLKYVDVLDGLDTKNVEPTFQTTGLKNVLREDKVVLSLTQEEALSNAKRKHKGYFVTKSVFE